MGIIEILLTSFGVSMDAFAVSICKGLFMKKYNLKASAIIALYFGLFQGLMPLIGYLLGVSFQDKITPIDHFIAFILLGLIGYNMLTESFSKEESKSDDDISFKTMIILSIATSIDALAVGITFAFLKVNIIFPVLCIVIITFLMCLIGTKIGNIFGYKCEKKAQRVGGIILILLGIKILIEHIFFS